MLIALTILHVLICLFLIAVVLLQSGKGGDIAATFGGMGSQTAFGPRGAGTVLTKATAWAAVLFMITSLTLAVFASRRTAGSVLDPVTTSPAQTAPAPPAEQPPPPEPR
jgi:preprotein translocase subunit SecG